MPVTISGTQGIGTTGNIGINTSPATPLHLRKPLASTQLHPYRAGIITEGEGDNIAGRIGIRYSGASEAPYFLFYRSRGTLNNPTAVQSGDLLGSVLCSTYDGINWQGGGQGGGMFFTATENWTPTNFGNAIFFNTASTGPGSVVTERVRISSNPNETLLVNGSIRTTGQVFTPSRPAFCANINFKNFNTYVTGNTTAIGNWDAKQLDTTNNFNITTGRFTAPVTGVYWITTNIAYGSNGSTGDPFGDLALYRNGVLYSSPIVIRPYHPNAWESGSISLAMFLNVNDFVTVGVSAYSSNVGLFYLTFSGYLIG